MDFSYLATFLLGLVTGAGGNYLGTKYTDARRKQEETAQEKGAFADMASQMSELLREMKRDVETDGQAYTREIFLLPTQRAIMGQTDQAYFSYYDDEHAALRGKFDRLQNAGFVVNETHTNTPKYRMTEEFVEHLKNWRPS